MIPLLFALTLQGAPQNEKDTSIRTTYEYRNSEDGITFKVDNVRVLLTIPDGKKNGDTKLYQAASLGEFRRLYPELVKKYDLDQYVPRAMKPEAVEPWWKDFGARCETDLEEPLPRFLGSCPTESTEAYRGLGRGFQDEQQALRDLERRSHPEGTALTQPWEENRGARLGILVAPVTDALRSQLNLPPHEGLVVAEVQKGSLAEKSGLEEHDVLLKISGQVISGSVKFRDQVQSALHTKAFTLDLIRGGKKETVTVNPGSGQPKG